MNSLSPHQLSALSNELKRQRQRLEDQLDENNAFGLAASLRDATGELSTLDNHPADLGSELFERGKDLALLEQAELALMRTEEALRAIEDGRYGRCMACGDDIPFARLQAVPETLFCTEHAPRRHVSDRRPIEEQLLQPPFGRTSMDEQEAYNGFDGEDSWQIVAAWGNSDSPAMAEHDVADYEEMGIESGEPDGYVEDIESFLATDMTGNQRFFYRNRAYDEFMHSEEEQSSD